MTARLNILLKTKLLFLLGIMMLLSSMSSVKSKIDIGSKIPLAKKELQNIDGKKISLASAQLENGLLVVFSCNTCPFVVGRGDFEGWEKQYNTLFDVAIKSKIGMVLINSNEAKRDGDDSLEAMIAHAKEQNYKMPYLLDVKSKIANAFEAKTTPHVYLFGKNAQLVYSGSIDNSWDTKKTELKSYLKQAIKELATSGKVETVSTAPKGCSIKRK